MSSAPNRAVRSNICAPATDWLGSKDVNERYSQELVNMVMQKYQAAEVGTFNPNLPLPM